MRSRTVLAALIGTGIWVGFSYALSSPIERDIELDSEGDLSSYCFFYLRTALSGREEVCEWMHSETGKFHTQYACSFMDTENIRLVIVPRPVANELGDAQLRHSLLTGDLPSGGHSFPVGAHSKMVPLGDLRTDVTARYRLTVEPSGEMRVRCLGLGDSDWQGRAFAVGIGFIFFGLPLATLVRYRRKPRTKSSVLKLAA